MISRMIFLASSFVFSMSGLALAQSASASSPIPVPILGSDKPQCTEGDTSCLVLVENESVQLQDFGALGFVGVPEDSRCPLDVLCFWAGQVRVQLKLNATDITEGVELGLGGNLSPSWTDSRTGSQLVLEQVWPEKILSIPTEEPYQIKLRLLPPAVNNVPIEVDPIDTPVQADSSL